MTQYNSEFPFTVAFPLQPMTNVLAEWLKKKGIKQARIAGLPCFLSLFWILTSRLV
jgi:bisphosphoglycerate-independent phosphoglycerate mutase (AlkP superfamily)